MHRALYRKWRPQTFDDVCGQNHITDILKYEVENEKTSHAYLFCGSRGTGKTTCAKILAKAVNCLSPVNGNPCNACASCRSIDAGIATDVVEMDAASNTGVDNVRDIKEDIVFTPAELRYRVYIIDEVHMLSTSAFNALLKTLEEPPAHVIFILATTEMQKLPSTVISRCQRFDFRRIGSDVIVDRLTKIAEGEGITLTEDAGRIIARLALGGMRDAISLFELCAGASQKVDAAVVNETLGVGSREETADLVRAIAEKNYEAMYAAVQKTAMSSRDITVFWQELIDYYRDMAVVRTSPMAKEYLDLSDSEFSLLKESAKLFTMPTILYHQKCLEDAMYAMVRAGFHKRSTAELALTRMCDARLSASEESLLLRIEKLEQEVALLRSGVSVPTAPKAQTPSVKAERKKDKEKEVTVPQVSEERKPTAEDGKKVFRPFPEWKDIVETLTKARPQIARFLETAKAYKNGEGEVYIRVTGALAASLLSRPDSFALISGTVVSALPDVKPSYIRIESAGEQTGNEIILELSETMQEAGAEPLSGPNETRNEI